jgi:NADPH:quinone reductase-like Zn-dependent oxidoreductase
VFDALDIPLPELDSIAEEKDEVVPAKDEWAVVLGGSSSVGKFAVQVRFSPT